MSVKVAPVATVRAWPDERVATLRGLRPMGFRLGADPAQDRLGYVRAASAIRRVAGGYVVVQDDANVLALLPSVDAADRCEALLLPPGADGRRLFGPSLGNKAHKLDLEAAIVLPDGRFVAFGSGSTPARCRLVVWSGADGGTSEGIGASAPAQVVDAAAFYQALADEPAFAGSELNVEGATLAGGLLLLAQRGNGAADRPIAPVDALVALDLAAFVAWLDGRGPLPALGAVVQLALGDVDGVRLTVTDLVALPGPGGPQPSPWGRDLGPIALLTAAEASPNTYDDGEVVGCRLALWDAAGLTSFDIQVQDGAGVASACTLKLEGIEIVEQRDDALVFVVVVDMDDESQPAQVGELTLSRRA